MFPQGGDLVDLAKTRVDVALRPADVEVPLKRGIGAKMLILFVVGDILHAGGSHGQPPVGPRLAIVR
jgi:hypothetical protein